MLKHPLLKAAYRFEGNANDWAGTNHGTVSGATVITGSFGRGYSFNGTSDRITVPDSADFDGAGSLSVFSRVLKDGTGNRTVISHCITTNPGGAEPFSVFRLGTDGSNELRCWTSSATTRYIVNGSGDALSTGTWYWVGMTWDGSNVRGYVNAKLVGTTAASITKGTSTREITIGCDATDAGSGSGSYGNFWDGDISEILFFNKALTQPEVSALMLGFTPGEGDPL